ncbi:UNVERIFIED_CONTAM: Retrovirus-related Pol polyprotein from type-2 retrotransposable element R2DM [Sesamum calycinum]|uniref:Retrovirus-related Pol polyprotein from type-2 retrotransposable element R2DM n=1 Tax=Sesamum calycinum TaxID=2727403 RepID=A0AAW2LT99_9LAMI
MHRHTLNPIPDVAVRDSLGDFRKNATFLAEAERHFYYQKAKIHFLKQGDRNTKFFHDMVKRNAARNSILANNKADGSIITSALDIAQEFVDFYTSLLGQSHRQRAVMDFFRSGRMLRQLNHTIIALVPKSEHSLSVADYRPISCCNVIYKVIIKIIADRLSPALEQLIDSSQAAFVGGRNITDNIFLAQEMVRQYSRKRISPRCTINVDLRKAFDSVSWTFLSRVLHGYGFPPLFISWIMECVSTTSFSVALNGSLHGLFPGKKGLRQGDPMSPALFLLCMEYFSRLIKRNTTNSDFNFHPKCEKLKITHLLFVDDLMLFSR